MADFPGSDIDIMRDVYMTSTQRKAFANIVAALEAAREEAARLDFIERTYSGMTNRERYLPVQMIWGKGCNGRTLREACDKYREREGRND